MKRRLAPLLLAVAAWSTTALAAPAPAPASVAEIERDVHDDPAGVLREASAQAATLPADARAERLRLLVRQVVAAGKLDRVSDAAPLLPEANALARELRARDMQCLLQASGLYLEHAAKGWAAVAETAASALKQARAGAEAWCVPRLLESLAFIHSNDGRRAAALEAGHAAEAAFKASGETLMLAVTLNHLAWALSEREEDAESVRRSIELGGQALAIIDPQRQRYLAGSVLHNLAGARIAAKDWQGARQDAAASEQLAQALGEPVDLAYVRRQQGEIELRDGRPALALARLRDARRTFTTAGIDSMVVATSALEAEALVALRRPAEALRVLADAEAPRARAALPKCPTSVSRWRPTPPCRTRRPRPARRGPTPRRCSAARARRTTASPPSSRSATRAPRRRPRTRCCAASRRYSACACWCSSRCWCWPASRWPHWACTSCSSAACARA